MNDENVSVLTMGINYNVICYISVVE